MIKAIAIENEQSVVEAIGFFCKSLNNIILEKTFTNPKDGLKHLNKFPVDVLFLSTDLSHVNSMELCKQIKQDTAIIFTTSSAENVLKNTEFMVADCLVKSFTKERFVRAIKKAVEILDFQKQNSDARYFFVRADFSLTKVNMDDIIYCEALDDYVKIHLYNQKTLVTRITMKEVQERLPEKEFLRIHRSFIVAKNKVECVHKKMVKINGRELPLGLKYEAEVLKQFENKSKELK